MESSALNSLPLLLVSAGLALFVASFRLAALARQTRRRMDQLLGLAGASLDPLDLPAAAWPALAACGWRTLTWQGWWFGQPVEGRQGESIAGEPSSALSFEIGGDGEARLHLQLTHASRRGEQRLQADQLARVFVLLLETRLRARTEALAAALAERARLSLYLEHDLRNLAQWVEWVCADFAAAGDETALGDAARRLRDNAPLAQERAARLNQALLRQTPDDDRRAVALRELIERAATVAGLQVQLRGDVSAWAAPALVSKAFDHLFAALAPAWRNQIDDTPEIVLMSGDSACVRISCLANGGLGDRRARHLFDPFFDGQPGGIGLGCYQARKCLREAGGDIEAGFADSRLTLSLRLPSALREPE